MQVYQRESTAVCWGAESTLEGGASTFYYVDGVLRTFEAPEIVNETEIKYYDNVWKPSVIQKMRKNLEGRIEYYPYKGRLFQYALGVTDSGTDPETLTLYAGSGDFPSLEWRKEHRQPSSTPLRTQYKGAMFTRMKWTIEGGNIFTVDADIKSSVAPAKPSSNTSITGNRYALVPAYTSTVSVNPDSYTAVSAGILRAEIELDNNPEVKHYVEDADGYPTAIHTKGRKITGRVSFNPQNTYVYDAILNNDTTDLTITVKRDSSNYCVIKATDGTIKSSPHNVPEEGPVEGEVELEFLDLNIELYGTFA